MSLKPPKPATEEATPDCFDELHGIRRDLGELYWLALDASDEKPSCGVDTSREKMGQLLANVLMNLNFVEDKILAAPAAQAAAAS
jgi:hypothetical protein